MPKGHETISGVLRKRPAVMHTCAYEYQDSCIGTVGALELNAVYGSSVAPFPPAADLVLVAQEGGFNCFSGGLAILTLPGDRQGS